MSKPPLPESATAQLKSLFQTVRNQHPGPSPLGTRGGRKPKLTQEIAIGIGACMILQHDSLTQALKRTESAAPRGGGGKSSIQPSGRLSPRRNGCSNRRTLYFLRSF